ncbi:MAG: DUF4230 domain-containing protein [Bacteroidota bacterium]|nr:DUF4230 domain-containing protein [Bacteroidota bacterium]
MQRIILLLILIMAFLAGVYCGYLIFGKKSKTSVSSTVILEKMKDVFKVASVEAQYSELLKHEDYTWLDLSFFRKKAIVRVQASVLAGVNLDSTAIQIDEKNKIVYLKFDHNAKIISIDHSLDYYDLQQGTFNSFTPEELTGLQLKAKDLIKDKAMQGPLLKRASERRDEMLQLIRHLLKSADYTLIVEDKKDPSYQINN